MRVLSRSSKKEDGTALPMPLAWKQIKTRTEMRKANASTAAKIVHQHPTSQIHGQSSKTPPSEGSDSDDFEDGIRKEMPIARKDTQSPSKALKEEDLNPRAPTMAAPAIKSVQCFGRKKTAVAVACCKHGRGLIKINGCPIELVEPEILRFKASVASVGRQHFASVDIRIRVKGGGHTSQIYAIRQSIDKALVAFYQKYMDEQSKKDIKSIPIRYDRTLLVADPRRCEPKKFGGRGARPRFQKLYR